MRRALLLTLACLPLAAGGPARAADAPHRPVVVELFTSQGCYSCPPADRLLGALSRRRDVLALSFHVDYWNYLGWADPFSHRWATTRQRAYAWAMKRASVYTPQMVVDGRYQAVGSNRAAVAAMIRRARDDGPAPVAVAVRRVAGHRLDVSIAPGASRSTAVANVWLVLFDRSRTTDIPRGENGGKRLTYHHVVRVLKMIGDYSGRPIHKVVAAARKGGKAGYYGAAVLVQRPRGGRILGAAVSLAATAGRAAK
jgi:hypothetical protein